MRKINKKHVAIVVGLITVVTLYFVFDPSSTNLFPKCPFLSLTGFKCPGCGSQRALHHLLHLDVISAFQKNPLLVTALPYILFALSFEYLGLDKRYPKVRTFFMGRYAIFTLLVIVISYWITRNIFDF